LPTSQRASCKYLITKTVKSNGDWEVVTIFIIFILSLSVNRVAGVLNKIISGSQMAYVPGRDNNFIKRLATFAP